MKTGPRSFFTSVTSLPENFCDSPKPQADRILSEASGYFS